MLWNEECAQWNEGHVFVVESEFYGTSMFSGVSKIFYDMTSMFCGMRSLFC